MNEEKVLIIIKPDAIARSLFGDVVKRFERKGLKIIGIKMVQLKDFLLEEHYSHIADKPFFTSIKNYMKSSPVILIVLKGVNSVKASRLIIGPTDGSNADAGSIRGDFALSMQSNLVHASDSVENGEDEVKRFFEEKELFDYKKPEQDILYSEKTFGDR